jgi:hypothetical protein
MVRNPSWRGQLGLALDGPARPGRAGLVLLGNWRGWLCAAALAAALAPPAHAGITRYCDKPGALNAAQHDKMFRFGAVIKDELEKSGARVALIARSGTDLSRFGVRYSHAGFSLKASPDTPWAVRQLYYACEENKPLIFDQGMAAFLLGTNEPDLGYVSVLLLPQAPADQLEHAALDNATALQLLGGTYSANSYPFSDRYQNCNQWVAEILASAWGTLPGAGAGSARQQAQAWLRAEGYVPQVMDVGWRPLMWLGSLIPWVNSDDHPDEDTAQALYRVSMPASLERFVQARHPGTTRLEICHNERHVVVRRGWVPVAEGCEPGPEDTVIPYD